MMVGLRLQRRQSPLGEAVFVAVIAVLPAWLWTHLYVFDTDVELPPRHILRLFGASITGITLVGIFGWVLGHLSGLLIRPLVFAGLQLLVGFANSVIARQEFADLPADEPVNTVETIYAVQPIVPSWLTLGFLVFASTLIAELVWRAASRRHSA
jgi:hypothetical protein